jgi:hypothetical protein
MRPSFSRVTKNSALQLAAALLALTGCETTVDIPEPAHTPRVALRYTLTNVPADSSFADLFLLRQLFVSNSQRVFDTNELEGRSDATVEIRDAAGAVVERFRPIMLSAGQGYPGQPGYYRPTMGLVTQLGQTYTLRAALPGLEPVESTITMPLPAVVVSGTFRPRSADIYEVKGRLTLTLQDDPATANYYLAFARLLDQQGQPGPWSVVEVDRDSQTNDFSAGQFQLSNPYEYYSTNNDQLYPFADTDVNGQRIVLASDVLYHPRAMGINPSFMEVHVSSITPDDYRFYLSRRRYFESHDNPFAEPAPLVSNVKPGYGLFGGATDVTYRIPL